MLCISRTARFSFDARRAERRDKKRRMFSVVFDSKKIASARKAGLTRGRVLGVERVFFTFQDEILHCGRQGHEVGAVADTLLDEVLCENRYIVQPFPERRNDQFENVQAMIEIFAELAVLDQLSGPTRSS